MNRLAAGLLSSSPCRLLACKLSHSPSVPHGDANASASTLSRAGEHVDLTNRFAAATFTRFARSTAEVGAGRAWEIGRPDVRNRTVTFPSSLYDRPKRFVAKGLADVDCQQLRPLARCGLHAQLRCRIGAPPVPAFARPRAHSRGRHVDARRHDPLRYADLRFDQPDQADRDSLCRGEAGSRLIIRS